MIHPSLFSERYLVSLAVSSSRTLSASRRSRASKDMNEILCQNAYRTVGFCYRFAIFLKGNWEFYQHNLSLFLHLKQTRWTALWKVPTVLHREKGSLSNECGLMLWHYKARSDESPLTVLCSRQGRQNCLKRIKQIWNSGLTKHASMELELFSVTNSSCLGWTVIPSVWQSLIIRCNSYPAGTLFTQHCGGSADFHYGNNKLPEHLKRGGLHRFYS